MRSEQYGHLRHNYFEARTHDYDFFRSKYHMLQIHKLSNESNARCTSPLWLWLPHSSEVIIATRGLAVVSSTWLHMAGLDQSGRCCQIHMDIMWVGKRWKQ